ncbi:MAG: 1,4-alpha-glucan branching protein GlgB [Chlamydia sp.]
MLSIPSLDVRYLSSRDEIASTVHRFYASHKHDPHTVLGVHKNGHGATVIRLFRPSAEKIYIQLLNHTIEMHKVHENGFFELQVPPETVPIDYKVFHSSGLLGHDPYSFSPTFSEVDQYLFTKGVHYDLYKKMGARRICHQGVMGTSFTVWAPSARSVALVGDHNFWDGRVNPMRSLGSSGIWELFIPELEIGSMYKFELELQTGEKRLKTDPFALQHELRPKTSSIISDMHAFRWSDSHWIAERNKKSLNIPINVYEVHLGSFKRDEKNQFLNYRELAHLLATYCQEMHFTHIELLPITEHPLDESWGYQTTGYFAPTSRFGTLIDFQYFVDYLHNKGIGVFLDWVPGHFPEDSFALHRFDGTALFEHEDPKQGFHPHWNTAIFNFGRHEVSNFLLASALFWLDIAHIDGLRVDAVASMLYLDYGREAGEWIPNRFGGKENLEAIEFIKHTNAIVHDRFPGVLMIAEESTAFPGITTPVEDGGLGFDLKWNMGWMNDTLRYFQVDSLYRTHHHNQLTFGLLYAFTERFQLVLSHDEVVHGKGSLLSKMAGGDLWQKFANVRLLYSYYICQPGKKLLFMGGEIGQWNEWSATSQIEWFLTQFPYHRGVQKCVQECNALYREQEALWGDDFSFEGFEWVDFSDSKNSIISYIRKKPQSNEALFCIHNFTPTYFSEYRVPLQHVRNMQEIFNSDSQLYSGSGKEGLKLHFGYGECFIEIPPLATVIYKIEWMA